MVDQVPSAAVRYRSNVVCGCPNSGRSHSIFRAGADGPQLGGRGCQHTAVWYFETDHKDFVRAPDQKDFVRAPDQKDFVRAPDQIATHGPRHARPTRYKGPFNQSRRNQGPLEANLSLQGPLQPEGGRGGRSAGSAETSGASRSPSRATRSSTSVARKRRSSGDSHMATSSHVTGVETVGCGVARNE